MNIVLLYIHVRTKLDPSYIEPYPYSLGARRFKESYLKFKPEIPHRLLVVNSGVISDASIFEDVAHFEQYHGRGWDCGTYQAVARRVDCDLLVCFNTLAYFWQAGWLEPFVRAVEKHGKGVYGPSASYELHPHLRTPCIAFHPEIIRDYPIKVDSRDACCQFEHRGDNFSIWAKSAGYPVLLVTKEGEYEQPQWRAPDRIFRRADQANMLVWDRHSDDYAAATPEQKRMLASAADGLKS